MLGKYLGMAILYITVVIISTINKISIIEAYGIAALIKVFLFFILQPLTILTLALYGDTKFKTLNNKILIIIIYILNNWYGNQASRDITNNTFFPNIRIISSLISPFGVVYRNLISAIFTFLSSFNLMQILVCPENQPYQVYG